MLFTENENLSIVFSVKVAATPPEIYPDTVDDCPADPASPGVGWRAIVRADLDGGLGPLGDAISAAHDFAAPGIYFRGVSWLSIRRAKQELEVGKPFLAANSHSKG